jgi:hypothetical protein
MHGYNYDRKTGEFLNESVLDTDPQDSTRFLIPANCTTIKPIVTQKGEIPIFNEGSWTSVKDYRGSKIYNKETTEEQIVTKLGDIPENFVLVVPKTVCDKWNGTQWVTDIAKYKLNKISYFSNLSLLKRIQILPDYKLNNALYGVYGAEIKKQYLGVIKEFRSEFYRIQGEIEKCSTVEQIDAVKENFPTTI